MSDVSNIVNTPVLLHGIGSGVFKTVSGKILEVNHAQTMKFDVTSTSEDVFGGDSLFPIYTYLTKKEGTIEIDAADFSVAQLNIAQQTTNKTTGAKRLHNARITKSATKLVDGATFTGVEVVSMSAPDGTAVTVATTAADGVISVTDAGVVAFGASAMAQDGEYSVWFRADEANALEAAMLKSAMPEVAEFNWKFTTIDSEGNKYQIDVKAKRTRSDGKFSLETGRDKATVPKLTVKILDPGDDSEDFATITISKLKD